LCISHQKAFSSLLRIRSDARLFAMSRCCAFEKILEWDKRFKRPNDKMSIDKTIPFPITVTFADGEQELFEDATDLEMNLEMFDSDRETECHVQDALGRTVRLTISENLDLEVLELVEK
jgi:hypothetical protein